MVARESLGPEPLSVASAASALTFSTNIGSRETLQISSMTDDRSAAVTSKLRIVGAICRPFESGQPDHLGRPTSAAQPHSHLTANDRGCCRSSGVWWMGWRAFTNGDESQGDTTYGARTRSSRKV